MVRKTIFLNVLLPTSSSTNRKNLKKTRQVIPNKTYALQRNCIIYNFIYLTTNYNIWCFCTITTSGVFVQSQHLVFFCFLQSVKTHNNLLVFIIFHFNSLNKTLESDNTDNVSQELFVSPHDCTKLQDNQINSINRVTEFKILPKNLYIAPATITLYQKKYRTDPPATVCSVKVHVFRLKYVRFSHPAYVHDQKSFQYDMIVSPEMCRLASKKNRNYIFWWKFDVPIVIDLNTQSNFNDGQAVSSTFECTSR